MHVPCLLLLDTSRPYFHISLGKNRRKKNKNYFSPQEKKYLIFNIFFFFLFMKYGVIPWCIKRCTYDEINFTIKVQGEDGWLWSCIIISTCYVVIDVFVLSIKILIFFHWLCIKSSKQCLISNYNFMWTNDPLLLIWWKGSQC